MFYLITFMCTNGSYYFELKEIYCFVLFFLLLKFLLFAIWKIDRLRCFDNIIIFRSTKMQAHVADLSLCVLLSLGLYVRVSLRPFVCALCRRSPNLDVIFRSFQNLFRSFSALKHVCSPWIQNRAIFCHFDQNT